MNINQLHIKDLNNLSSNDGHMFPIKKNCVVDIDGNYYDTIDINGQTWMTSNLKTTHYNDGSAIEKFYSGIDPKNGYYCNQTKFIVGRSAKLSGYYYNFACINTHKLAPLGWHVPSIEEWEELVNYVTLQSHFNLSKESDPWDSAIAKSLCSKNGWNRSSHMNSVGRDSHRNNSTGFDLYPSGFFSFTTNDFEMTNEIVVCASTTINMSTQNEFYGILINKNFDNVKKTNSLSNYSAFNVRCIKD